MDDTDPSKKRWSYLKKGDIVWAKWVSEVWPAEVTNPCTADLQITVDWLTKREEFTDLDPSPLVLEKFVCGRDPSATLQPLETQKQKQEWKKLHSNPRFKAALAKANTMAKKLRDTEPLDTLRVGDKLSFYAPHQNHSKDSIISCTILRVMDAASIQQDRPLETDSFHRLSVDDEVFFKDLPSTALSCFILEEGIAKECGSNSVVESLNRHRKALAEKVPSAMSDLLLEPKEQKKHKQQEKQSEPNKSPSPLKQKNPRSASCRSDDEEEEAPITRRASVRLKGRPLSLSPPKMSVCSGASDSDDSDTDVRSCGRVPQPKRKEQKIKNISCKSDDENMPLSSQEDICPKIIADIKERLQNAETELEAGGHRAQLVRQSVAATRAFFLNELKARGVNV